MTLRHRNAPLWVVLAGLALAIAAMLAALALLAAVAQPARALGSWLPPVANAAALPASGNVLGDSRLTLDDGSRWWWDGDSWELPPTGAGGGGIGGSTGATDNAVLCADGTGGATAQACDAVTSTLAGSIVLTDESALVVGSLAPYAWLKADALALSDGDPVSTWTDSSGNGRTASNTTTKRPVFKTAILNGKPVIRYDGSNDCLVSDATWTISTFSVFVVFSATNAVYGIYEHGTLGSTDGSWLATTYNNTTEVVRTTISSLQLVTVDHNSTRTAWGATGQWHAVFHHWGGSHADDRLWLDGAYALTVNGSDSTQLVSSASTTQTLYLGCRNEASSWIAGDIAEFILFTPALTAANERRVARYLQSKYNL